MAQVMLMAMSLVRTMAEVVEMKVERDFGGNTLLFQQQQISELMHVVLGDYLYHWWEEMFFGEMDVLNKEIATFQLQNILAAQFMVLFMQFHNIQ